MNFVEQIVNNIIRPQREEYNIKRLGSNEIDIISSLDGSGIRYFRDDHILRNQKGERICMSYYWSPSVEQSNCVIYLHANNGSRIEGLSYLSYLFERQQNLCTFDFSGSGNSGGEYVTLGLN